MSTLDTQTPTAVAPEHIAAFDHPVGKIARETPGGALGWRGTLLHIHIAPAASFGLVTAPLRSCAVPILVAAYVVPPRARNTAMVAMTFA